MDIADQALYDTFDKVFVKLRKEKNKDVMHLVTVYPVP